MCGGGKANEGGEYRYVKSEKRFFLDAYDCDKQLPVEEKYFKNRGWEIDLIMYLFTVKISNSAYVKNKQMSSPTYCLLQVLEIYTQEKERVTPSAMRWVR